MQEEKQLWASKPLYVTAVCLATDAAADGLPVRSTLKDRHTKTYSEHDSLAGEVQTTGHTSDTCSRKSPDDDTLSKQCRR